MLKPLLWSLLLLTVAPLAAQLPNTQVYAFDISQQDTSFTFSNPRYLTGFNARGYNNQPAWLDDNTLLVSVQLPEMEQPDIFKLDLAQKTQTRMTRTLAGEYSPQPIGDGRRWSAIRQEYLGQDTVLRLWEFPSNLENNGKPVFKYVEGIGYYHWLNNAQLALFLVKNPNELALASTGTDNPRTLATGTGRSFQRLPNGNLAYVDKSGPNWEIREQNLYRLNAAPRTVTQTLPGSEDFIVLPDGSYLMGSGSRIYRFDPVRNPRWAPVVDLRFYGITDITRLAFNNRGTLAVVSAR